MKGKISEIFDSVQGEGIYCGERQIFVRLFGCNINCGYCDTKLEYFKEYSSEDLLKELGCYTENYHSLVFTGGEPLMQKDFLKEAAQLTSQNGYRNYLETNGILHEELGEVIDFMDIIAMDLKLPSSTGLGDYWEEHSKFLQIASKKEVFLKSVVCQSTTEEDLEKAVSLIKQVNSAAVLVFQPNSFEAGAQLTQKLKKFKAIASDNGITACVISQIHKIIGLK